jgi:Transglycosylase SLT domain
MSGRHARKRHRPYLLPLATAALLGAGWLALSGTGSPHIQAASYSTHSVLGSDQLQLRSAEQTVLKARAQHTELLAARESARDKRQRLLRAQAARMRAIVSASQPASTQAPIAPSPPQSAPPQTAAPASGIFSPAQLGSLWLSAGGSSSAEQVAICIAEHESGGNPGAISPTDDYGLWQEHAAPQALNPATSAAMAVSMSANGTNWSAWTTASSCGV